ncbi:MAG: YgaP family membrane protein [Pontibacterium sp.]
MKANVGQWDRVMRAVLGVLIIAAGVYFQSWFGAIGVVLVATAAIKWCPLYLPFGLSSRKKAASE